MGLSDAVWLVIALGSALVSGLICWSAGWGVGFTKGVRWERSHPVPWSGAERRQQAARPPQEPP